MLAAHSYDIYRTSVGDTNFGESFASQNQLERFLTGLPNCFPLADTDDWRLSDTANPYSQDRILANFDNFLDLSKELSTGFIVLAHDLYTVSPDRPTSLLCSD